MKTVREIAGKPGRMCDERREGKEKEGGKKKKKRERGGGDEKEVISGLFSACILSAPLLKYSEEKHIQGGALLKPPAKHNEGREHMSSSALNSM